MTSVRVAAVQDSPVLLDRSATLARVEELGGSSRSSTIRPSPGTSPRWPGPTRPVLGAYRLPDLPADLRHRPDDALPAPVGAQISSPHVATSLRRPDRAGGPLPARAARHGPRGEGADPSPARTFGR